MICVGGPLDGRMMPDFGTAYFCFRAYDKPGTCGRVHSYRHAGNRWVLDDAESCDATLAGKLETKHGAH